MKDPFRGNLSFYHINEALPPAMAVLRECCWNIDSHNAPYLAGKAAEPSHELVELTADQAFGITHRAVLPQGWSEADNFVVVGDINNTLGAESNVIVARTSDFKQAGELAEKIGYRPALTGEFLQLLWWLQQHGEQFGGWFYCYAGRNPRYAILAYYNECGKLYVIFDTYIGDQAKEGYVSSNADNYCFFVYTPPRTIHGKVLCEHHAGLSFFLNFQESKEFAAPK